jgi:REP element-mobilizing transposase RayT
VIGKAQEKYGMKIHAVVAMSDHMHYLLSPKDTLQQARFFNFVNANVAKELKRLFELEVNHFWDGPFHSIVVSEEPAAQLARLRYNLAHGVKEDLVERTTQWPGVHSARVLLGEEELEGTWFDRTAYFWACHRHKPGEPEVDEDAFKTRYKVELSPLPCLADSTDDQQRKVVREMVDDVEEQARKDRERRGATVLGVEKVMKQPVDARPKDPKKSPAPFFHSLSKEAFKLLLGAYREFCHAFREAAEMLKSGIGAVSFPPGSFPPGSPYVPMTA